PPPPPTLFPYTTLFRSGPLAAFVCATSLLVWGSAQTARMDVSFTAFITLGIWMLQRESLIAAAIALGIATMIKGPMAIVIAIVRSEEHTSELQSLAYLV